MFSRQEPTRPTPQPAPPGKGPSYIINGRCMLTSGDEYPCTAHGITTLGAEITIKAHAQKGTAVICYLDNIGILRGTVREPRGDGFHLAFDMNDTRRARVAARIEWHESRAAETAEQRAAPRIVPIQRDTEVRLGEQLVFKARIVDLSMSGVALTIDSRFQPFVGSLVQIGKRFATVVRPIKGGFAAEFKLPFSRETFNQHVVL